MRAFVTGATGFIGRRLVARLRAAGDEVDELRGDILDPNTLDAAGKADVVYHLAAQAAPLLGERDALGTVRTNVVGTIQVAAAMRPSARIVFASTAQVYARSDAPCAETSTLAPISAYGASKLSAEYSLRALASRGPQPVVLRLFNVYGPQQSETYVVGRLIAALRAGKTPVLGAAHPIRDFVHVDDVVEAFVHAASAKIEGPEVVNVGTGVGTSIRALAEATGREVRFEGGARAADTDFLVADITKARRVLGWEPRIALADGIRRSLG